MGLFPNRRSYICNCNQHYLDALDLDDLDDLDDLEEPTREFEDEDEDRTCLVLLKTR